MICAHCPKETIQAKDGLCKGCRLRAATLRVQKYFWTPELEAKLRRAYAAKNKRLVGLEITELMRRTGWPRYTFNNRAQILGLHCYTSKLWTREQIEAAREMAGTVPALRIAKVLGRSVPAVRNKLSTLGMESRFCEGFSLNELCSLFGTRHAKITQWIERRWLNVGRDGRISHASVQRFVWEHMEEYRFAACEEWWLKTMLKPGIGRENRGAKPAQREEEAA